MEIILSFMVTMFISVLLIPIVIRYGTKLDIVAKKNHRTVHKKEIVRIGGYAIYISFLLGCVIFLKTDSQINAILLGGFLVFLVGLYDDVYDLSPKIKFLVEVVASLIVILYGNIYLRGFYSNSGGIQIIQVIITVFWIVGITNAINFIDGLDGLSAGISIIVLVTISLTSLASGRTDIASLSLVLAGAIMGFLFFNFHPAKIFMGDSGALFIGFMIAVISLLGFGYNVSTFFTLGAPIVVLMVPIMDTLIAIVRRAIGRKKIFIADKSHVHHNLMFRLRLGHTKSVLTLYVVTMLFSLTSFIYLYDALFGIVMFIILMFSFQLFVELTDMIGRKYKPLLTIANIFIKSDNLPKIKALQSYRENSTTKRRIIEKVIIASCIILTFAGIEYYMQIIPVPEELPSAKEIPYVHEENDNQVLNSIFPRLERAFQNEQRDDEGKLVASYFITDFLTLKGRQEGEVGGLHYVYGDIQDSLRKYALSAHYINREIYPDLEVISYEIISYSPSTLRVISGKEDNDYYTVLISYNYNEQDLELSTAANIILMYEGNRFYVVGVDEV
jgi:UDP-N-acetylmuramyl pentapeptide phosphotransferase/UDP-N-acetylglucosamine-1-phosphate transferase